MSRVAPSGPESIKEITVNVPDAGILGAGASTTQTIINTLLQAGDRIIGFNRPTALILANGIILEIAIDSAPFGIQVIYTNGTSGGLPTGAQSFSVFVARTLE